MRPGDWRRLAHLAVLTTATLLSMSLPAILLAAGASLRLGRPKQMLQHDGETLLGRTIHAARQAGADPILVVLGAHAHEISASVPLNEVVTVLNPDWQEGIASSLRAGLRSLLSCIPDAAGVLLLVCDQPRLASAHIRILIESFHQNSQSAAIASTYRGARGIPAIFPRLLFPRLLALHGDKGARGILADPACAVVEVLFPGGEIDVDSPADLDYLTEKT
jgi:molybdenum cofactor cytidylyltransferase